MKRIDLVRHPEAHGCLLHREGGNHTVYVNPALNKAPSRNMAGRPHCYYCYYMDPHELKVARIGNSRGVRLPADTLKRYQIGDRVIMEERAEGILLRPAGAAQHKLSWEETAREMAASTEDWSAWDATLADGLEYVPWDGAAPGRAAEPPAQYRTRKKIPRKRKAAR